MPKLYEIIEEMNALQNYLDSLDEGEQPSSEAIEGIMEPLQMELSAKAENMLKLIRGYEAESEMYATERKRLQALEQSASKKAESVKQYLTHMLTLAGYDHKNKNKVETSIGKIGFQKNPASIEITDFEKAKEYFPESFKGLIPDNFLKKPIIDKVKDHLKDWDEADLTEQRGIKWVNNTFHMRVR